MTAKIKTHAELMARHLSQLKVREKELTEQISSMQQSLIALRELIKKEEAAQKKDS